MCPTVWNTCMQITLRTFKIRVLISWGTWHIVYASHISNPTVLSSAMNSIYITLNGCHFPGTSSHWCMKRWRAFSTCRYWVHTPGRISAKARLLCLSLDNTITFSRTAWYIRSQFYLYARSCQIMCVYVNKIQYLRDKWPFEQTFGFCETEAKTVVSGCQINHALPIDVIVGQS